MLFLFVNVGLLVLFFELLYKLFFVRLGFYYFRGDKGS